MGETTVVDYHDLDQDESPGSALRRLRSVDTLLCEANGGHVYDVTAIFEPAAGLDADVFTLGSRTARGAVEALFMVIGHGISVGGPITEVIAFGDIARFDDTIYTAERPDEAWIKCMIPDPGQPEDLLEWRISAVRR